MPELGKGEDHAYGLAQTMHERRTTTQDALSRLARMGHLTSRLERATVGGMRYRPARRVYRLTAKGRRALQEAEAAKERPAARDAAGPSADVRGEHGTPLTS